MLSRDEEPIIALCTPSGKGALALLRLSGKNVRVLVDSFALLPSRKKISLVPTHTIQYGTIIDQSGNHLDKVLFFIMDAPHTFTGQDVIEISCHNNQFIIESIIQQAILRGARLAEEGEFTRRAFELGKIDLIQAESIHELIGAQTQYALKKSLAQLEGSFSQWVDLLKKELLQAIAWCEASFEFLDEEVEFGSQIRQRIESLLTKIHTIKQSFNAQQQIRQGIRIALIGSVNAGKSSLFNALLKQKRAIVTDIPGTTRDSIEAGMTVRGNFWTLIDTAGLRNTDDRIEQEGIKRSHEEAQAADIILLVIDGSRSLSAQELAAYQGLQHQYAHKIILIHNKADQPIAQENKLVAHCALALSAFNENTAELLEHIVEQKISHLFETLESSFLLNKRQHSLLLTFEQKLTATHTLCTGNFQYELISYHLQDALTTLSELTGRSISEASLDMVFKEFCVGK